MYRYRRQRQGKLVKGWGKMVIRDKIRKKDDQYKTVYLFKE